MSPPMDHLDASPSETVRRHAATFRRVRQARADALSDGLSDGSAIPEPEVAQREALSDEVPPTAAKLAKLARGAGWAAQVVYSRSGEGVDAVTVRCQRGGDATVAYWRSRRWAAAVVRHRGRHAGPTQKGLAAYLLGEGLSDEDREGWRVREFERLVVAELSDEDHPGVVPSDEKR